MKSLQAAHCFKSRFSLEPLLNYWRRCVTPQCSYLTDIFNQFEQKILRNPELDRDIESTRSLDKYQDILIPLMSVVFPSSTWDTDISGVLTPFQHKYFYGTPNFRRLLVADDGTLKGRLMGDVSSHTYDQQRRLRAYWLILDKIYGIHQTLHAPLIRIVPDPDTGLDRYYRILPDWRFVEISTIGPLQPLSPEARTAAIDNITDLEVLGRVIPAQEFEFRGLAIIRAMDVTESAIVMTLERNLIDKESIFSTEGFRRLQGHLRTLFGRPDLRAGMGAVQEDQVLVINDGDQTQANCIFRNSSHIPIEDLKGSVWMEAVAKNDILNVRDLREKQDLCLAERDVLDSGIRSMLIAPLHFKGEIIGTFQIMSPRADGHGAMDKQLVQQVAPLFSIALKRGLDDLHNELQSIIQEKCTAVHPSVAWRFNKAALSHMERLHTGQASEMEPIIFRNVFPLFAQADIRGSAEARNKSIQADLVEQLMLAGNVLQWAGKAKSWPLIKELQYRIEHQVERLREGFFSDAETSLTSFLKKEIEPAFAEFMGLGPRVTQAIEKYSQAIDPQLGFVFRKRKEFEESVSLLTGRLSSYLDQQEVETQKDFPHYFEKHQTDGLDYVIYVGASMMADGRFNDLHYNNLALWQLIAACGMARQTSQVKPELKVPLDTCHLILYQKTPLSIRFRYDEKRFDVDGAYDVRHEIVKSRLDKAFVKGGRERLTQPGRIAIVYSHAEEGREIRQRINFMHAQGQLLDDMESLELDDLPSIRGLKALRVGVNLETQVSVSSNEYKRG
jgi:hypothetical protein